MYSLNPTHRLGLYEKALPNTLTWEEKLQAAKELGFDFIEISVDETDEKRARLDWSDEEIYQLAGYDVYYEPQSAETHARFIQGMKDCAALAEKAGIMLGVEIMNTPYLNSLSKFEVLKHEIPSPYFMAYPDVGNISGWNHDVYTEIKMSREHIIQVHLKDTYKVSPEYPKGQFRDLVIGEGQVDFPVIFQALKEINYHAPFVIEMWANDDNWKENIITAKERLSQIAQQYNFNF